MLSADLYEEIIVVLTSLLGIWLAYWVYDANKKEKLNQWFAVMTFFVILWVNFAFLGYSEKDTDLALFFYRLNSGAVSLFFVSFSIFFIIYFLKQGEKYRSLLKIIFLFGVIFAFLSLFTDLIIKEVAIKSWGTDIIFGTGNIYFYLYAIIVVAAMIGVSFKTYFQLPLQEKSKAQYFLIGTLLFILFNIVFNIILPLALNTAIYQHYGDYSAIFLLGFTAYAIVKKQLFGIKVVIASIIINFLAILLLVNIILSDVSIKIKAIETVIFAGFLLLSQKFLKYLLREDKKIRSLEERVDNLKKINENLTKAE